MAMGAVLGYASRIGDGTRGLPCSILCQDPVLHASTPITWLPSALPLRPPHHGRSAAPTCCPGLVTWWGTMKRQLTSEASSGCSKLTDARRLPKPRTGCSSDCSSAGDSETAAA